MVELFRTVSGLRMGVRRGDANETTGLYSSAGGQHTAIVPGRPASSAAVRSWRLEQKDCIGLFGVRRRYGLFVNRYSAPADS
jgi:hypothetical protein